MKKFLSLVTGLSVVVCGGALLVGCGEKETPPAQPKFVVSADVKTKVAEAINVINNSVYNKLTGEKDYTVDGTTDGIEALTEEQYYVELGKVENVTDVQSIELGGVTYNADAKVSVSVGNNSFINDKAFTYSLGSLKIAAPVLAFELRPTMTIKVNGTTFNLTNVPALTVGNLEFEEVVTEEGSHNTIAQVEETNEYNVTLRKSNSYFVAKLKAEDKAAAVHFLTRSMVNNEARFGFTGVDNDGFGFYFGYKDDGSVDPALDGTTRETSVLYVNEDGETAKQADLTFNLSVVQGDTEFAKLVEDATDGVVTLPCDFELTKRVTFTKNVTINLNGHTIKFAKNNDTPDSFGFVVTNGKLTINGEGSITSSYQKIFGINDVRTIQGNLAEQNIALEINGGTFESANCEVLYVQKGRVIINGGSFKSTDTTYNKDGKNFTLNCFNTEAGVNALIIVNGGSFYNFDPSNLKNDDRQGTYLDITTTTVEAGKDEEQDWFKVVPVKTIEVAEYAALKEAVATANAGDTIKLTGNISTTENDVLEVNKTLTLDLDTHSISADNSAASADKKAYLFKVVAGGKLTVVGTTGSITSKNQIPLATVAEDAVLVVKGGNFVNNAPEGANLNHETVYCYQGKIEILGGTFKTENKMTAEGKLFTINCNDTQHKANKTSITITGGKFWKFDPATPNTNDATTYLPLGYATKVVDTDWHEVELAGEISVKNDAELREALRVAKVGATIKLTQGITLTNKSGAFSINKDLTLDLNGQTLNADAMASPYASRLFNIDSGVHFTIKDTQNGTGKVTTKTVRIFWLNKDNAELTIESGTFETAMSELVYVQKASKVVINGGSFKTTNSSAQYLLNIYDTAVNASITVNGGEFKDFDPSTTSNDEGIKLGDNKKSTKDTSTHSGETWYKVEPNGQ